MKTTYQSKNTGAKFEDSVAQEQVADSGALVDMYLTLKKTSDKVNSKAMKEVSVDADVSLEKSYEKVLNTDKEPKKKKGSKIPIVLCVLMFLSIVGFFVYKWYLKTENDKLMVAYNEVVASVDTLYTQLETSDKVDTESIRVALISYEDQGIDTTEVHSELNSIDAYISDRAKIKALSKSDVNLVSKEYRDTIDEVELNAEKYSVADLRVSIKGLIKDAEKAIENYTSLKAEILADDESTVEKYSSRIDSIIHDLQRSELYAIINARVCNEIYANELIHLSEVNVPVENEDVPDNKLNKAKREAKAAAIEARDLAVQEVMSVLAVYENDVYTAYCNLYSIQDTMNGTTELEKFKAMWEEAHSVDEETELDSLED